MPAVGWTQGADAEPGAADVPTLDTVEVTATRQGGTLLQTPASVQVVEGTAFANGLQVNLSEALGRVPGLQVQNRHNYAQDLQIIMRGFGARSTFGVRGIRIYVDDIPATMPDGQGQTSNIDITSLDRIEVLNGPFSSIYGNAAGGVLQMYTAAGTNPPSVTVHTAAGSDGALRYGVQAQGRRDVEQGLEDYNLSATRFETDGYRDHSEARRGIVNARLGVRLNDTNRLKLVANHVDIRAQDPLGMTRAQMETDRRAAVSRAHDYNTRKKVKQSQLGAVWESHLNADNLLRMMAYHGQRETRQYQSIPPAPQLSNRGHAGGIIDLERQYSGLDVRLTSAQQWQGRDVLLIAGLAYDHLREQRRGFENFIGSGAQQQLGVQGALRRDETNTVWNIDPYVQASIGFAPGWNLDAGLRYSRVRFRSRDHYIAERNGDDSGSARYSALLPSLALRKDLTDEVSVYGSYGRGFETPTTNELSYRPDGSPGLNLALRPAESDNWELGLKAAMPFDGLATVALFRTDTDDEIVNAGSSNGRSSFHNAGKTRRDGLELAYSTRFLGEGRIDAAYTYLKAQYRTGSNRFASGASIPGIPKQSFYLGASWAPAQGWQAGAELRHVGRIYVNDANSDAASAYTLLGLHAGYVWQLGAWNLRSFARLDNALDKNYVGSVIVNDGNGRFFEPAPGRSWTAGVTLRRDF
ncbi:TonB-dependent receptor [Lampropedia cohaerens]|uniref:TonB-dependent receptor n=1 Tax=Lampropedia cohaerens TaxID=1610491 RepID=A0A0U1Q3B1_9BURK|nr:TonB-dependent receptor [Lampropedia cohaerens]